MAYKVSLRDWLKIALLIIIPVNAWLGVMYYQNWRWHRMRSEAQRREKEFRRLQLAHFQQTRFGIKEGSVLRFPLPYITIDRVVGGVPPIGRGVPVLLLNISWIAEYEVWAPAISEALRASPYLYITLLYSVDLRNPKFLKEGERLFKHAVEFWKKLNNPRVSLLASNDWYRVVGGTEGTLLILCDERGVIRKIEPYPELKVSPYWSEEVVDWCPKLHQSVKKVLDEFFPPRSQ